MHHSTDRIAHTTTFVTNKIETNKVKKEHYLVRQDNTIHKFSIKLSFSNIGQDK